jgi:hypothetical protein
LVFVLSFVLFQSVAVVASNLGEEFPTNRQFSPGVIVSIDKEDPEDIVLSTLSNGEYLLGVVTQKGSNTVTYAKNQSQVTVSLTGEVIVYVSDANGLIKAGDFVGASWLEGVGMKALKQDQQKLVGVALEDFDESASSDYGTIDTSDGDKDIRIDAIRIRLFDKEGATSVDLSSTGIEGVLENIAGKSLSPIRLLVVSTIFILTIAIAGFFVSSSIKGSFASIGRNPLASDSIYKSLRHVTFISIITILVGTVTAYVILVV